MGIVYTILMYECHQMIYFYCSLFILLQLHDPELAANRFEESSRDLTTTNRRPSLRDPWRSNSRNSSLPWDLRTKTNNKTSIPTSLTTHCACFGDTSRGLARWRVLSSVFNLVAWLSSMHSSVQELFDLGLEEKLHPNSSSGSSIQNYVSLCPSPFWTNFDRIVQI